MCVSPLASHSGYKYHRSPSVSLEVKTTKVDSHTPVRWVQDSWPPPAAKETSGEPLKVRPTHHHTTMASRQNTTEKLSTSRNELLLGWTSAQTPPVAHRGRVTQTYHTTALFYGQELAVRVRHNAGSPQLPTRSTPIWAPNPKGRAENEGFHAFPPWWAPGTIRVWLYFQRQDRPGGSLRVSARTARCRAVNRRALVPRDDRLASWTRGWPCSWLVKSD